MKIEKTQPTLCRNQAPDQNNSVVEENLITTNFPETGLTADSLEEGLSEEDTAKLVKEATTKLWDKLGQTEKNAIDTANAMDQIERLNANDIHREMLRKIANDPNLSYEEKVRIMAIEDERQNRKDERATDRVIRLEDAQGKIITEVLTAFGIAFVVGVGTTGIVILCSTSSGRAILSKTANWAAREIPNLIRQAV